MGREAQREREAEGTDQDQPAQQVDPAAIALSAMNAFEDRRFLVQTVAVSEKDANGMRELTVPISPMKQITLVFAPELQEHIMKQLASGIEVADLAAMREETAQAEAKDA